MPMWDAESEKEDRKMYRKRSRMLKTYADVFDYFWSEGDGEGGGLLMDIREVVTGSRERPKPVKLCNKIRISQGIRTKVFERDLYRCKYCQTHVDLTVDHIHPESKGGTLDMSNLQTLCRSCNAKKGSRS